MDTVSLRVPVTVKAKLTEKLRGRLFDECDHMINQMDLEIRQIELDKQRELDKNPQQETQIHNFFDNEIGVRQSRRAEAFKRKEMLEKLAIGAEIIQGTTERVVELKVGDNIREAMSVEILVEDDKIIAIRG